MTNSRPFRIILLCLVLGWVYSTAESQDTYGFTLQELHSALDRAGLGAERICNIQTFGSGQGSEILPIPAHIAVLSTSHEGWKVSVFRRVKGGFQLEWSSHKLPDEFAVSSPDHLSIEDVGDESVVTFSGCAAHMCNGVGGVAGFLVYSTSRKQAFFVRYSGANEYDTSGSEVKFSRDALQPANAQYKAVLQRGIDSLTRLDRPASMKSR